MLDGIIQRTVDLLHGVQSGRISLLNTFLLNYGVNYNNEQVFETFSDFFTSELNNLGIVRSIGRLSPRIEQDLSELQENIRFILSILHDREYVPLISLNPVERSFIYHVLGID